MSSIWSRLVNLASNVTGILKVANGGTGAASLTTNSLVLAQGTSALTVVTADTTTTHVLHGGTPPTFGAIAAGDLPTTISAMTTFSGGVQFATTGGTPTTLNYYQEDDTQTSTFHGSLGGAASASITFKITRIGRIVTVDIPTLSTVVPTSNSLSLDANTALAAWARPTTTKRFVCAIINNNADVIGTLGQCVLNTTGVFQFYRDFTGGTAFTNSANAGWEILSVTYGID